MAGVIKVMQDVGGDKASRGCKGERLRWGWRDSKMRTKKYLAMYVHPFFLFYSLPNLWLIRQTDPSLYQEAISFRSVEETLNHCLYMLLAVFALLVSVTLLARL